VPEIERVGDVGVSGAKIFISPAGENFDAASVGT